MLFEPFSRRKSMLRLIGGAIVFSAGDHSHAIDVPCGAGLIVLTVGGLIGAPNRAAFDPVKDRLLQQNNLSFTKARTFNLADLAAFPQHTVSAIAYSSKPSLYRGPRLSDVLFAANPLGSARTVRLSALDGYAAEIALSDVRSQQWILAMEADGKAFSLGDLGPLYAVRQLGSNEKKTDEEEAKWVFGIYYIEVLA